MLVKLDDAGAMANFEAVRQRYLGFRAMQGRLQTEQAGKDAIDFHPDLQAAAVDPLIRQQMLNQELERLHPDRQQHSTTPVRS